MIKVWPLPSRLQSVSFAQKVIIRTVADMTNSWV
jgi:hypothetical protein